MTDELVEKVARAIAEDDDWWEDYGLYAERAIAVLRPIIRAEALEEAAKLFDPSNDCDCNVCIDCRGHAAAIRAMKKGGT